MCVCVEGRDTEKYLRGQDVPVAKAATGTWWHRALVLALPVAGKLRASVAYLVELLAVTWSASRQAVLLWSPNL